MKRISPELLKAPISYPWDFSIPEPISPPTAEQVRLTRTEIKAVFSNAPVERLEEIAKSLDEILSYGEINSSEDRMIHFLAQTTHETNRGKTFEENLNYSSVARMRAVFKRLEKYSDNYLAKYVKSAEDFGNFVYDSKEFAAINAVKSLGNVEQGDGFRFRGSGGCQLSGRSQFKSVNEHPLMKRFGVDIVANPDAVRTDMAISLMTCVVFWERKRINALADKGDYSGIARRVNPGERQDSELGTNRKGEVERIRNIILNRQQTRAPKDTPPAPPFVPPQDMGLK